LTQIGHSLKNNKSTDLVDISPYLLKIFLPYMLKPLLELVIASILGDIFPSTLKQSVVQPVYENGMKEGANAYHLVTFVPALLKILEKVVINQIIYFLDEHNILCESQFGFKKINPQKMLLP
jgi:hypothetical protein